MAERPQQPRTPTPTPGPGPGGKSDTSTSPGGRRATPVPPEVPTRGLADTNHPTLAFPNAGVGGVGALVGQVFGDFELTRELGRGGMGVVYRAVQRSLDREVALKLLLAEHASNAQLLQRFLAEARAAASLTHPNIVTVFQVGQCAAGPYFVMELIDGPSLESLLQRQLPADWVVKLLVTVAEAVQHAHDKGIVHRDLKPANIMIHQQKRPVVMDFGIAKVMGRGSGMTTPGTVVGTPAYMPPEQAGEEADRIGPHSDVYSLGAILYTLLTGRAPFDEGTALRTILKVISPDPAAPVRDLKPEVPGRLEQITMRCLEKDPLRRYATAQALADDLKRFRAGLTGGTKAPPTVRHTLPTVLLTNTQTGKQYRLFTATTVIGRSQECDLVLKSADVSKRHCQVSITAERVTIEDLGSVNGTSVNGKAVERSRLRDGDELDIAGHVFAVQLLAPGAS